MTIPHGELRPPDGTRQPQPDPPPAVPVLLPPVPVPPVPPVPSGVQTPFWQVPFAQGVSLSTGPQTPSY